jgi:hypothetical protein
MTKCKLHPVSAAGKYIGLTQHLLFFVLGISGLLIIVHPFLWTALACYGWCSLFLLSFCGIFMVDVALHYWGMLDARSVKEGWAIGEQWVSPARMVRRIRYAHRAAFPSAILQSGAVGRNIRAPKQAQGRQSHRSPRRQAGAAQKNKSSRDAVGGGEGDPEDTIDTDTLNKTHAANPFPRIAHPPLSPFSASAQFFSFRDLAIRWSCSAKTLRNKVSTGKLPRPTNLPIGPRWPLVVIEALERGEWKVPEPAAPTTVPARRGRPPIAASRSSS